MKKSQGEGGKKGNPYNKNKSRELSQKRELIREKNMMEGGKQGEMNFRYLPHIFK